MRSSCALCSASVVCSACRDNSLSLASASSAGSASTFAARTPEETVKLAKKPMADRMITRAINHLWSSLKICFLKRAIDG
ncbi:Uncharacterised protein [Mycobacterium tuberculosis]|nr:Uncharacterised protein [Mycobacterium tuberculosis]